MEQSKSKNRKGFTIVSSKPLSDGWNKVMAIDKNGIAQEYMMKASDEKKAGLSEFLALERNASTSIGQGYIFIDGEYYQVHRDFTSLEEPIIID
jgi:hypothetical protein